MATSKVEIANMALIGLRATTINDFDEQTAEANAVRVIWDTVRRTELAKHPYNFAIKRALLPRLSEPPVFGYQYQYQLPVDCLRVLRAEGIDDYKIEGSKLLTNSKSIHIKYVYDNTDISSWSPSFADLVAARLRVDLSYTLAADTTLIKVSKELYDLKAREVKWIDSSTDIADKFGQFQSSLISKRY